MCMCVVCCACVLRWLCVCVESECGVCAESVWDVRLCCGVVVCCAVSSCVVLVLVLVRHVCVCAVWCLWCVCAWCVLCVRCGVCGVCVWRGLARGKPPVCRFKTSPCVGSKSFRVYRQNARMWNTCARFAGSHGSVLNLHKEASLSLSLLSFSLPSFSFSFSSSLFSSSFSLSLSLSLLVTLSFSARFPFFCLQSALCVSVLNYNDNDRSSSWLSLYTWL